MKEVLRGEIEEIWWRSKKLQTGDSAQCDTKTRLVPVLWGRRSIEICHGDNRHVVWEATESVKVEQGVNIPHFLVHRQRVYSQQKMTYSWFLVLWIPAVYQQWIYSHPFPGTNRSQPEPRYRFVRAAEETSVFYRIMPACYTARSWQFYLY